MLKVVRQVLQNECALDAGRPLVVGVSGGPDSLCLLDLLRRAGYQPVVAHLNHGLRAEAAQDADSVAGVAARLGLPYVQAQVDTPAYAEANALSIEEAARILRYQFLFEQAHQHHAQAVAVGHTADDQVETVLMHLLRGAGLAGLKGMVYRLLPNPWSADIALLRPLLGIWRSQIVEYCEDHDLQPVLDRSNLDTTYFRNRLRHELIPYLEGYQPRLRSSLARMAEVLAGEEQVLQSVVETAWQQCVLRQGAGYVVFDRQILAGFGPGVQRRLLRKAIEVHRPGLRDIDFEDVERGLAFLAAPPQTNQVDLVAGLGLFLEQGCLWLAAWEADLPNGHWPALEPGQTLAFEVPGVLALPGGWSLQSELVENTALAYRQALENGDPFQAWMDADALELPLILRSRQRGDRFQPLGMAGRVAKLSDIMINLKLPRRARRTWPLMCSGQDIAWLPGYRLGHGARVQPTTRRIAHLHLYRGEMMR
ncbi:MAG TPA: tRNA lysidine(34) synthetase TilS [Anaerolineales bacterium]|nr:tRNA lysidine(34) synthetase TilS [Anaerolineales bacterium]